MTVERGKPPLTIDKTTRWRELADYCRFLEARFNWRVAERVAPGAGLKPLPMANSHHRLPPDWLVACGGTSEDATFGALEAIAEQLADDAWTALSPVERNRFARVLLGVTVDTTSPVDVHSTANEANGYLSAVVETVDNPQDLTDWGSAYRLRRLLDLALEELTPGVEEGGTP